MKPERIHELNWTESVDIGPVKITALPARHFSGRGISDRNQDTVELLRHRRPTAIASTTEPIPESGPASKKSGANTAPSISPCSKSAPPTLCGPTSTWAPTAPREPFARSAEKAYSCPSIGASSTSPSTPGDSPSSDLLARRTAALFPRTRSADRCPTRQRIALRMVALNNYRRLAAISASFATVFIFRAVPFFTAGIFSFESPIPSG